MRKSKIGAAVVALTVGAAFTPMPAMAAQGQGTGGIQGVAKDIASNPLPKAGVNIINPATGASVSSTTTATNGAFTMTGIAPGTYTVQITQIVNGVATVVGTTTVTVAAGTVATISVATSAISALAAAGAAAAAGGGLITGSTLAIVGGVAAAGTAVAVVETKSSASGSS